MTIPKENWILLALRVKPLNARQLYLTLFYIWDELDRQIPEYFSFKAPRYGPYPAGIYSSLYGLSKQNLILMPISFPKAGVCSLTDQGKATAESISPSVEADTLALVERVSCDISELKPSQLVRKWQSEVPEFANPPLASPEIRKKAIEILRYGKRNADREVEKLLGWHHVSKDMACQLGITYDRLKYLCGRDWYQQHAKQVRIAEKTAKETVGNVLVSNLLGFSIWLPNGWLVSSENIEVEDVSEGAQLMDNLQQKHISADEAYRRLVDGERAKVIGMGEFRKLYEQDRKTAYRAFFEGLLGTPGDEGLEELASRDLSAEEAYKRLMADPETFVIDFMTFKQQYEEEDQMLQRVLRSKKKKGSQVGYWSASPREKGEEDPLLIEVIKFHFRESMSSLELYSSENPGPENVRNSCRPATRKDLIINGMQAVKAYYTRHDVWVGDKREPGDEQFSTYLAEGLVGWTIDCWYTQSDRLMPRSLFHRIVSSFHRI